MNDINNGIINNFYTENIKIFYTITSVTAILFFFFKTNYFIKRNWYLKILLLQISAIAILINLYTNNKFIGNYFFPLLLFLNILILIPLSIKIPIKFTLFIANLAIIMLLCFYDFKRFRIKRGILINPDKRWIYLHILVLIFWYIVYPSRIESKIGVVLLILYPLFFDINQYFMHRSFTLSVFIPIYFYFF